MRGSMAIVLSPHESGGVVVDVWVVPGSSRDEIVGMHDGALRVRTSAPAEGGRANRAVASLVADWIGAKRAHVISGHTSRRKKILAEGVTITQARARSPEQ
jgi:uncharacterized protein